MWPLLGCAFLLAAAGCGESEEPVAFASFAIGAREAICDWSTRCLHVPDRATCERLLDPKDYSDRRASDSLAAGLTDYDAVAAARCLASTRDGFCLAVPFSDPSCARVFVGVRGVGEACTSVRECASGVCEISSCPGQCCDGVCGEAASEPPAPVEIGGACEGHGDCAPVGYCETNRHCARFPEAAGERCLIGCARGDLYCDIETFTCKPYGGPGEACDAAVPGALPCDPAWAVCDGVCRPRPGLGEVCNTTDRLCIASTRCDEARSVCVARAAVGEMCANRRDCQLECDLGLGVCAPYEPCSL